MRERLLITTAIGLMLGAGAYAQSPSEQPKNSSPPAAQSQNNSNSSAPSASSSTPSSQSSTPSTQNTQASPSASSRSQTTTSQSTAAGSNDSSRSQAQSHQASPPSQTQQHNNAAAPSQTQSAQQPNSSSRAQTNTAPPANNRTQASPSDTNTNTNAGTQPSTNTAAQPSNNQTSTAQSRSCNVNISANLDDRQRTRVTESITELNARPVENVNFSLSVGTVVPRDVRFQPLPADVVEVVPQYRGYNFFVVRDDVVIVDPSSYQIVDVLPRTGRATAAAPASRKMTFSDTDREVIRKHARSARTEQRTTGSSSSSTRVRVGDRLPDSVEIRSFPEEVYRESPTLREYRYIERDNRTYVVEPHERTIIEEID